MGDSAWQGHQGTGRAQAELADGPELLWAMVQALEMSKGGSSQRGMGRLGFPSTAEYVPPLCHTQDAFSRHRGESRGLTGLGSGPVVGVRSQVWSVPVQASPGSAGAARVAVVGAAALAEPLLSLSCFCTWGRVEESLLVLWGFTDMKDKVSELPQLHFPSTGTLRYLSNAIKHLVLVCLCNCVP